MILLCTLIYNLYGQNYIFANDSRSRQPEQNNNVSLVAKFNIVVNYNGVGADFRSYISARNKKIFFLRER